MIKKNNEIKLMREAGHILFDLFKYLEKHIKPGITTNYLNELAEKFIEDKDCEHAFKNYGGFPKSICTSINNEVVHGIPSNYVLKDYDVLKIDAGIKYKGYYSDSAYTYIVGKQNKEDEYLIKHTEQSLYEGINKIKSGIKLKEVSLAIENYAKKHNLGIIRELVGHGIGKDLHEKPEVPNYVINSNFELKAGMTIAIEPMLTIGNEEIYIKKDKWTIATLDNRNTAHFEHTVLVKEDGYEILTKR